MFNLMVCQALQKILMNQKWIADDYYNEIQTICLTT